MTPLAWILTTLLKQPVHYTDRAEPTEKRERRLTELAEAIDLAAKGDARIRKALIVVAVKESGLAAYVQEGRCKDGPRGSRCDPLHGEPRARTPFQVWCLTCPAAWSAPKGSVESTRAAAACTAGLLRSGWARCHTIEGMFAAMWGRPQCTSPGSKARAEMFERL